MKIQFASDLHIEFPENREFLEKNPLMPAGDILVLAGDILPLSSIDENARFLNYISENFETTYWLPGNHEYYHCDISDINGKEGHINEKIKDNIFLVNNVSLNIDECRLVFSTLWTKITRAFSFAIEAGYADFRYIFRDSKRLDSEQYNLLHEESVSFLRRELEGQKTGKTIVVTHHMPTFRFYPEEFKGNIFNDVFAVELEDLIEEAGPDFWIFGHHHSCRDEFRISKTLLSANPLGYVMYGEQKGFSTDKTVEI